MLPSLFLNLSKPPIPPWKVIYHNEPAARVHCKALEVGVVVRFSIYPTLAVYKLDNHLNIVTSIAELAAAELGNCAWVSQVFLPNCQSGGDHRQDV